MTTGEMVAWSLANIAEWLPMSPLEVVSTVFGLLSVWFYVQEHVWSWPAGLINVALCIGLYAHNKLYAEASLQVVYVVLQLYGWWQWLYGGERKAGVVIVRTSVREWLALTAIGALCVVPIGIGLERWTDSCLPWWDAFPTVLSLLAQWMISKKKLENWWVWIVVNYISIPLFAGKELYLIAGLNVVFLILSLMGFLAWRRTYRSSLGG